LSPDTRTGGTAVAPLRHSALALGLGLVLLVLLLAVPLPSPLLDILLALSLVGSVALMLAVAYTARVPAFTALPSALLLSVLARLALCLAASRLIVSVGYAGAMVNGFGRLLGHANALVGALVLAIFALAQIVVVSGGAQRMAEVAARFTLDALPGRQSALGALESRAAAQERERLEQEIDFYGAMDGAARFVRGDGIATVIIVVATFFGAGLMGPQLSWGRTAELSLGMGFATLLPALITSAAAALALSRTTTESDYAGDLLGQIVVQPRALAFAALAAALLAVVPGAPKAPLIVTAAVVGALALMLWRQGQAGLTRAAQGTAAPPTQPVDHLELSLGYSLLPLLTEDGGLLERSRRLRERLSAGLGLSLPPLRVRDDEALRVSAYALTFRGERLADGRLMPSKVLAVPREAGAELPDGAPGPSFLRGSVWVSSEQGRQLAAEGRRVLAPFDVLLAHLEHCYATAADRFLGRQEISEMLERLRSSQPALVREIEQAGIDLGTVRAVAQRLLAEQVPLRNPALLLEGLADEWRYTQDTDALAELVRPRFASAITERAQSPDGRIYAITLTPRLEELLRDHADETSPTVPALDLAGAQTVAQDLAAALREQARPDRHPVVLTDPEVRTIVRRLLAGREPTALVLSSRDLLPDAQVVEVRRIDGPPAPAETSERMES